MGDADMPMVWEAILRDELAKIKSGEPFGLRWGMSFSEAESALASRGLKYIGDAEGSTEYERECQFAAGGTGELFSMTVFQGSVMSYGFEYKGEGFEPLEKAAYEAVTAVFGEGKRNDSCSTRWADSDTAALLTEITPAGGGPGFLLAVTNLNMLAERIFWKPYPDPRGAMGLKWGDSLKRVEKKLKRRGFASPERHREADMKRGEENYLFFSIGHPDLCISTTFRGNGLAEASMNMEVPGDPLFMPTMLMSELSDAYGLPDATYPDGAWMISTWNIHKTQIQHFSMYMAEYGFWRLTVHAMQLEELPAAVSFVRAG